MPGTLENPDSVTRLSQRLMSVRPEDTARWGSMSASQMMCHLRGAFDGALGKRSFAPVPTRARGLLKFFALRVPVPWPHGVATVPELKALVLSGPAVEWRQEQQAVLHSLTELASATAFQNAATGRPAPRHPMFGPMTPGDWGRWGYLHTDHHLRQFGR